jgi:diguanylate cyclase (GGDEF)-like protein
LKNGEDAARIAEKIVKTLSHPFYINRKEIVIGASVGVSIYPRDGTNSADLMKKCDAAMYLAKDAGRGTFR